jgi:hypothetical protein
MTHKYFRGTIIIPNILPAAHTLRKLQLLEISKGVQNIKKFKKSLWSSGKGI